MEQKYTKKQGQYLAFIYYYTKINGCPPAEANMQRYFKTTLDQLGYANITDWSPILPSENPGEVISVLIRTISVR
ncbi:hypothetical protein [Dulcicalothrix desertica]|nr:hypothetical protein [Dulcicalothrix desertica]